MGKQSGPPMIVHSRIHNMFFMCFKIVNAYKLLKKVKLLCLWNLQQSCGKVIFSACLLQGGSHVTITLIH